MLIGLFLDLLGVWFLAKFLGRLIGFLVGWVVVLRSVGWLVSW